MGADLIGEDVKEDVRAKDLRPGRKTPESLYRAKQKNGGAPLVEKVYKSLLGD